MAKRPTIGVMLGDVTGIGPEITAKALASGAAQEAANLIVFGDARVLDLGIRNAGVTVTAGLKIVFTTPAHGTAYDIVGQGKADPGAMEHALKLAVQLASARLASRDKTTVPRATRHASSLIIDFKC